MAKNTPTQEDINRYETIMGRIVAITGTQTQMQLADVLEVRQSSISDAKRRASIPSDWLLKLEGKYGVIAMWLATGNGPQYVAGASEVVMHKFQERLAGLIGEVRELVDCYNNSVEVLKMTTAELQRKKDAAASDMQEGAVKAQDILARLNAFNAEIVLGKKV